MTWVNYEEHFGPDIDPDKVFAAVGRALCAWENMELKFATLYIIFHGRKLADNRWSRDGNRINEYGLKTSFETRMDMLKAALEAYHLKHDRDQTSEARLECTLDALIDRALELSSIRHQISHSVLQPDYSLADDKSWPGPGMMNRPTRYAITAPMYMALSLIRKRKPDVQKGAPPWMYSYRIKDIDEFAQQFEALGLQIDALARELDPDS